MVPRQLTVKGPHPHGRIRGEGFWKVSFPGCPDDILTIPGVNFFALHGFSFPVWFVIPETFFKKPIGIMLGESSTNMLSLEPLWLQWRL
jgi:hypothetical protein